MNSDLYIALAAQLFSMLVGIVAFKRRSVSVSGLIALLVASTLFIWLDYIALLIVLFAMFASSSALTHFKKSKKKEFDQVVAKHGPRDYIQAISNLGTATLLVIFHAYLEYDALIVALIGSVAAANADSWASEIGGISKRKPVLITTFQPVAKGISGGITFAGTVGGVAGSLFIVCISLLSLNYISPYQGDLTALFWASFIAGIAGFILDSYMGAVFQSLYKSGSNEQLTESGQKGNSLIKGYAFIDNDVVNFSTTVAAACIAAVVYLVIS